MAKTRVVSATGSERTTMEAVGASDDIFAELARKEKDLILAAELGKALLERNEELGRQNEAMADEFSERLEHLEQERHRLRLQIEVMEEEYEQRVSDLRTDAAQLRAKLAEVTRVKRESDLERATLLSTLTEQNMRLSGEVAAAGHREDALRSAMEELRGQFDEKRSTLRDHLAHLENLKEEIKVVNERKEALERRISDLAGEREGLSYNLDETSEKIIMLERHAREQESQIRNGEREMLELRETNQALSDRLESISRNYYSSSSVSSSGGGGGANMSLLNELEMSAAAATVGSVGSSSSAEWTAMLLRNGGRRRCSQIDEEATVGNDDMEDMEDMEEDFDDSQMTFVDSAEMKELRREVLSVYRQIKALSGQVRESGNNNNNNSNNNSSSSKRRRHSSDSMMTSSSCDSSGRGTNSCTSSDEDSSNDSSNSSNKVSGLLPGAMTELEGLFRVLMARGRQNNCNACNSRSGRSSSAESAVVLEDNMSENGELCHKMQMRVRQADLLVKQKDDEIVELQSRISMVEVQLRGVEEERDNYRKDLEDSHLGKDQLIRKAWETRDAAVKRKNSAEVELARERIGIMQVNSQLMEAIQQKVELSQQLEEWQTDMEVLLEEQIRERLVHSEAKRKIAGGGNGNAAGKTNSVTSTNAAAGTGNRFFGFFQRS